MGKLAKKLSSEALALPLKIGGLFGRLIEFGIKVCKRGHESIKASSNMLGEILVFADHEVLFGNPHFLQVDQPIV